MHRIARILSLALPLGAAVLTGCATTQAPKELTDARESYNRAAAGPGAKLAPAQLHVAEESLNKAEASLKAGAEEGEIRDLAYIAQRKAQFAESVGGSELAKQQKAEAEKSTLTAQETANASTQAQLAAAKEQLAKVTAEAKEALGKLASFKNAVKEDSRGLVITMSSNVMFASDKAALLPSARKQLDEIAKALQGAKTQDIVIEGHTDSTGSADRNTKLSQERAQAVVDFMAQKGIPAEHMKAEGKGPSTPVADNKTAEGRATNRRVEIVVKGEAAAKG